MARISGVTIPDNKQVQIALTYIYGIGPKFSKTILDNAKVDPTIRVKNLTDAELLRFKILSMLTTLLRVNYREL